MCDTGAYHSPVVVVALGSVRLTLTDHIPGDCSPPRALCYAQRTSLDTPEGATEH